MAAVSSLIVALLLALLAGPASATYAYPTPPPGWGGTSSAWTFGGTSAANAPWVGGSAAAGVSVNVGGRAVTMPMSMRLAANTGQVVARAALLTPLGRTASFIAWSGLANWIWNELLQRWELDETGAFVNERLYLWAYGGYSATLGTTFGTVAGAAGYAIQWRRENGLCTGTCQEEYLGPGDCASVPSGSGTVNCSASYRGRPSSSSEWQTGSLPMRGTSNPSPPAVSRRAVEQSDADALAGSHPMPDAVANDAQRYIPLPQQLPEGQRYRIPLGEPEPVPGTTPQRYRQPVADIVPSPSNGEPWRQDIQPRVIEGTDPGGIRAPAPVTGSDPTGEPSPESQQTDCDKYPEAAGCKPLGVIGPATVTQVARPMEITPDSGWGEGGGYACPADRVVDLSFGQITFPFALFCQAADMARPFVIAMGWLTAVIGFFGLGRRD